MPAFLNSLLLTALPKPTKGLMAKGSGLLPTESGSLQTYQQTQRR
jgi:hypothetical protein